MAESQVVTITLSKEELSFLVQIFGVDTVPGLGSNPFSSLSEESQQSGMAIVQRSLLARSILRESSNGIEIEPFVANVIGICVQPSFVVTLATGSHSRCTLQIYSVAPQATVRHILEPPYLHHLTLLPELPDLPSKIRSILEPLPQHNTAFLLRLTRNDLAALFQAHAEQGVDSLPSIALEDQLRIQPIWDIRKSARQVVLEVSSLMAEIPDSERVLWFVGEGQVWALENHRDSTGLNQAQISATTSEMLEETLGRMLDKARSISQINSRIRH